MLGRVGQTPLAVALFCLILAWAGAAKGFAQEAAAVADVVVVVDSSASMSHPGMDPERTSLLVTKLFADIVPGNLAVVRSLDLQSDSGLLPSRMTGRSTPCSEDRSRMCNQVDAIGDWYGSARERQLGALVRPSRADAGFKSALAGHLEQKIQNSLFGLGFRAAQGVFNSHGPARQDVPRVTVWLSDGETDDPPELTSAVNQMRGSGIVMVPIIFGRGTTETARNIGLTPQQVRNPGELVKAFAGVFRTIVSAPYEVDHIVSDEPTFEMKPGGDEAWVIVYGDDTLGDVKIEGPGGPMRADYAADRQPGAGAYRVLYVKKPVPGRWKVEPAGGGAGVAFAVVQRSALMPFLVEPHTATTGQEVTLIAALGGGAAHLPVPAADLQEDMVLDAEIEGRNYRLTRSGQPDGTFLGKGTFTNMGDVPVLLHAKSALLDRSVRETVKVSGHFSYAGGPIEIDLGSFKAPGGSCRDLRIDAEHSGVLPFELRAVQGLPGGQFFTVKGVRGSAKAGSGTLLIGPGETLQLCLKAGRDANSSAGQGEHWLDLAVADQASSTTIVPLHVRWNLKGLTWWERWRWLVFLLLGLLTLFVLIYGYIRPNRFPRNLALTFVPEHEELYEQTPQPIAQWRGIGIGWYRDARAHLHPNFRLSGKQAGALASLHALTFGLHVFPENGTTLFRETIEGEWEPIPPAGRKATHGQVFRAGETGPYFLITTRRTATGRTE